MLVLTGCVVPMETRAPLDLPDPEPLSLRPVKWVVVPVEEKEGEVRVLFGLNEGGYKNLSLNMEDIISYMVLQDQMLKEYRKYYEPIEQW